MVEHQQVKVKTMKKIIYFIFFLISISLVSAVSIIDVGSEFVTFNVTGFDTSSFEFNVILNNISFERYIELGDNATGSDGDKDRVLILNNTELSDNEIIIVDNYLLIESVDYNINHKTSDSNITFINKLWDDQKIMVIYTILGTMNYTYKQALYNGASLTGVNGDKDRVLVLNNLKITVGELINVDGFSLIEGYDYSIIHKSTATNITFKNKIWNDQLIDVRYYESN